MTFDAVPEAMTAYLRSIGRVALLSPEQERELAGRIDEGRRAAAVLRTGADPGGADGARLHEQVARGALARRTMIEANLRLVVAQARAMVDDRVLLPDVVQEGNVALIRAVERFDASLGNRFSTYATWWIRQAIGQAVDQRRAVHLPSKVRRRLVTCRRTRDDLSASLGRRPTAAEVARETGMDEGLVRRLLRAERQPASLDALGPDRVEVAEPDASVAAAERALTAEQVGLAVDQLPPLEGTVVRMRFGIGREPASRPAVARRLGVGVSVVRRFEASALRRLRGREGLQRLWDQDSA